MSAKDIDIIVIDLPRVKEGKSWKDTVNYYTPPKALPSPPPHTDLTTSDPKRFEVMRRDKLIKYQVQQCGLSVGMRVKPKDPDLYAKDGSAVITSIAYSYKEYAAGRDESDWPKNDMPFIVHARYENGDSRVVTATYNYFIPISSS